MQRWEPLLHVLSYLRQKNNNMAILRLIIGYFLPFLRALLVWILSYIKVWVLRKLLKGFRLYINPEILLEITKTRTVYKSFKQFMAPYMTVYLFILRIITFTLFSWYIALIPVLLLLKGYFIVHIHYKVFNYDLFTFYCSPYTFLLFIISSYLIFLTHRGSMTIFNVVFLSLISLTWSRLISIGYLIQLKSYLFINTPLFDFIFRN